MSDEEKFEIKSLSELNEKSARKFIEKLKNDEFVYLAGSPPSEEEIETLRINLGIPEEPNCAKCGEPIEVMEYMARKPMMRNRLCLQCTKDEIKRDELIQVLCNIETGTSHCRRHLHEWNNNELEGELHTIANQIKFLLKPIEDVIDEPKRKE